MRRYICGGVHNDIKLYKESWFIFTIIVHVVNHVLTDKKPWCSFQHK